jgi:hypothetical protein
MKRSDWVDGTWEKTKRDIFDSLSKEACKPIAKNIDY